jgi:hypothetical protein
MSMPPSPIAPDVLRLMRQVVETAVATRRAGLPEAAAEARGIARGRHPDLPLAAIDEAVAAILIDLGVLPPVRQRGAIDAPADGVPLQAAAPEEVADALAYAMRFDERGKARRTGHEYAARLAADQLVHQLLRSGFVVARRRSPEGR